MKDAYSSRNPQGLHPSTDSSYVEKLLEHAFISDLVQAACFSKGWKIEMSKPEVDDSGYDLIAECNSVIRHIQLKSSRIESLTPQQKVHVRLGEKPSGCVVWIIYDIDPDRRHFRYDCFRFFGGKAGSRLPSLDGLPVAKHTKANAEGVKTERPNIRVVKKGLFENIKDLDGLLVKLFAGE